MDFSRKVVKDLCSILEWEVVISQACKDVAI